jgi:uncharacterized protein (DUF885 family)
MQKTLIALALLAPVAARADGTPAFLALVDAYYAEYPAARPTSATELGLHDHDGDLEDYSQAGIARETARLKKWRDRFAAVQQNSLPPAEAADLTAVKLGIDASLLELERVQGWRRLPDVYSGLASRSIYAIMKRDFAPAEVRLASVCAREEKIPALLAEGKKNLKGVSRVAVDIALDEIPDTIDFFKTDVPSAFTGVKDAKLRARFAASTEKAMAALADYGDFLKKHIVPTANAPFALGEELFRAKLKAEEMIDTPLDELLVRGDAELKRLQGEFKATAAKIDPKRPYADVQVEMQKDHTTPEKLIPDTQARLAGLRRFLVERKIVTVPSEVMPKVEETPPFMRATTFASMETPGPFETKATEAYYNVTLPEKSWSAAQVEDFLRGAFNRPLIDVVSIHESFPGHYVQFLWLPSVKSKVRKFEGANSNVEGWAHYCEQMMLDEGYGDGRPQLRLAQLQDALLRAARYVVGIRMHARGMSFDDAVAFFQKEGYQSKKVAEIETRRGTEDPTYLYYTLGKLEILKLRDDYKKKLGAAYSLAKFHDAFLAEGALHLPLVRKALLGN